MSQVISNLLLAGGAITLLSILVSPSLGQAQLSGVPALAGRPAGVAGSLQIREIGRLEREFVITMSSLTTGEPLVEFEEELTRELHVIAVDSGLSTFIHEHAEKADPQGRFVVKVQFPRPGAYHIYADAAPAGLGQQVLRFDVPVGEAASGVDGSNPVPLVSADSAGGALEASDGAYTVKLDSPGLLAGLANKMTLSIRKDGKPAPDLEPYLGVPAHAVFVGASDLAYVHAHAMPDGAAMGGQGAHASHGPAGSSNPAELMLHATPPRSGDYALWVQFKGGGLVRTVRFAVPVADAP